MNELTNDVKLAQNGSTEAFSRLYAGVCSDMYHIALYSLRNPHDASDAVSEAVLDAFCSIKKLRDAQKFRSWIMKILSAKIKNMQKRYKNAPDELSDNADSGDFDFASVELRDALDRLDGDSRLLLSMAVLGGYTSEELSKICGMKPGAVRSKLSRIKEKLRTELS